MRRRFACVALLALALLSRAQPAHASMAEFIDYIFELSGPGGFWGAGYSVDVACIGSLMPTNVATGQATDDQPQEARLLPHSKCYYVDRRQSKTRFGASMAYLTTTSVPDSYVYDPKIAALSSRISAFPLMAIVDTTLPESVQARNPRLFRGLEYGAGFGAVVFAGARFNGFSKYYVEPRLTLKPMAFLTSHSCYAKEETARNAKECAAYLKRETFQVLVGMKFIGAVSSDEFGAAPGIDSGGHKQFYISVQFNSGG